MDGASQKNRGKKSEKIEEMRWSQLERETERGMRVAVSASFSQTTCPSAETARDPPRFSRIREISGGKRVMQDDGICHNLHCPGKIRLDRAMHGGGLSCPTGRS